MRRLFAQAKEFDPLATYTRYWVPELRAVPPKQVHEPWKLTDEEQKQYQVRSDPRGAFNPVECLKSRRLATLLPPHT